MRILIYGINYAPELTGIGKYTGEMSVWLAKQGHDVTVITSLPYYPEWEIHSAYKGKLWTSEVIEGVKIHRCPLYIPKKVTALKRILHELTFLLAMLPIYLRTFFQKRYDVVVCISPPFHLGLLPLLYCKLRGSRLVSHIQDLQVDAAKDLNMIKNESALKVMFGLEKFLLNNSSIVSTISPGMRSKISAKGISASKLVLFPNWVDSDVIRPLPMEQSLRHEFGLTDSDKVVLYSGNLGEKQGLGIIVQVAADLKNDPNLKFVIVGSGGGKENLKTLVRDAGLKNVLFFPLQPYEKLSALLATADIHLVLQKKSASDLVMPSKLTAILAAGGCALVTATPGTTLHDVVAEHNMGILIEPESSDSLRRGILEAISNDVSIYRKNARTYSEFYLEKENILRKWETELLQKQTGNLVRA